MQHHLLDLRLLSIFDAIMTERSLTRAACRLGMSQPALSNNLARLRDVLNDKLFIRSSAGMRPTPRALELAVPVSHALRELQSALEQRSFVPAEAERTFRLSMSPHASTALMPLIMQRVSRQAPNVRFRVLPKNNLSVWSVLDSNDADFVVGVVPEIPKRFDAIELFQDEFVAVMRKGHPLARGRLTLTTFSAQNQVLVTGTNRDFSLFDDQLKLLGHSRSISLTVTEYLAALLSISQTNLMTALFRRTLTPLKKIMTLPILSRPLPMDPLPVKLVWHPGLSNHPAYDWLRGEFIAASRSIAKH